MKVFIESAADRFELGGLSEFVLGSSTAGLGVAQKVPRLTRGAGSGASYRGGRTDTRLMDLDVFFSASDRDGMQSLFRRLSAAVLPREGRSLPRLVVEYPNGSAVEMPFVYLSGLEGAESVLDTSGRFLISVECPDPFWTARDALQFAVSADTSGTPFLNDLSQLPVTSSNAIGSLTVLNAGDVPADLTVILSGPSTGATTILVNGVGYVFSTALGSAEVVTVTRGPLGVTVVDQAGVNRYADLAAAPKFPQLNPGVNTVAVTMVGATSASRISGNYKARFEGVY